MARILAPLLTLALLAAVVGCGSSPTGLGAGERVVGLDLLTDGRYSDPMPVSVYFRVEDSRGRAVYGAAVTVSASAGDAPRSATAAPPDTVVDPFGSRQIVPRAQFVWSVPTGGGPHRLTVCASGGRGCATVAFPQ